LGFNSSGPQLAWELGLKGFVVGQFQAALFYQTEIAFILMDHGANVQSKNGQGWFLLLSTI